MKILDFFYILWVIFALLDPDPDPATQIKNPDPDPKPWAWQVRGSSSRLYKRLKMKTNAFAGGMDSPPAAEQESNDDITENEKDPSTSTRTRQVYLVKTKIKKCPLPDTPPPSPQVPLVSAKCNQILSKR